MNARPPLSLTLPLVISVGACALPYGPAEDGSPASSGIAAAGDEDSAGPVIVSLQTREGPLRIVSARDGVRYVTEASESLSLDGLRDTHPDLFEIYRRATAVPLRSIDARLDRSLAVDPSQDEPTSR